MDLKGFCAGDSKNEPAERMFLGLQIPIFFFLLEEIAGLLFFLKEDKEKENEDNDNGEGERRGEEEGEEEKEKPPRGCLCLKF